MVLDLLLLIVVLILILVILVLDNVIEIKHNDDKHFKMFKYRKSDFPLNVYFTRTTQGNSNFKILYDAVNEAIVRFNRLFDFKFFTINDNITTYPNIVTIQIACGYHYGCLSKFDDVGGVLAHATYPPYRLVCIDCKDINHTPLYPVIMHEFGHIVGLMHTEKKNTKSLMNAYIDASVVDFTDYDKRRLVNWFGFLK